MIKMKSHSQLQTTHRNIMDSSSQTEQLQYQYQDKSQPQQCQKQKQEYKHQSKRGRMVVLTKCAAAFIYNNVWLNIIAYFILCNIVHYYASQIYIYFCAYNTPLFQVNSMLMSPIVIISPHCMALRWLILESSNTIYFQLLTCCSWFISRLSK